MRILHLSTLYPPHIVGGAEKSVALLAEAQAALGHQVAAACLNRETVEATERNGVTVYRMAHDNHFWLEDVEQHGRFSRTRNKLAQPFNAALAQRFAGVLDDFRPDILHTHSMVDISSLLWGEAAKRGVRVVHTIRDYELLCSNSGMFKNGRPCSHRHLKCKVLTLDKLVRHRNIAAVAGVGTEILDVHLDEGYFTHIPAAKRAVIWNPAVVDGVSEAYVKPARTGPFRFGYLGRLAAEKGVDTLLNAARRLAPTGDWQVLVAGKSAGDIEQFEAMARGLPVEFRGFVNPRTFFEEIDLLVVPSLWAEPLPRTILESYAMSVPALGARAGGIPELIGVDNCDWLFEPGDAVMLADRMSAILARGRAALPRRDDFRDVLAKTRPSVVVEKYFDLYAI